MKKLLISKDKVEERTYVTLKFEKDFNIIKQLKSISGAYFSRSSLQWLIPNNQLNVSKVKDIFKEYEIDDNNVIIDEKTIIKKSENRYNDTIEKFNKWMCSIRYSQNTIQTYCDSLKVFFDFFPDKSATSISNEDINTFMYEYIIKKNYSISYQNQVINAIKLFYKVNEERSIELETIKRPKRRRTLPNVLSKEEVKAILEAPVNIKHRAMLSLIYSCGLRRSELLNLKITDIDSDRKLVIVRQAKGRKDRITPLSEKVLVLLREYYKAFKPQYWLFEGQKRGEKYDERSLANVLSQAVRKCKIDKPVSLHWLRHSYATHLLENGTDLRYIQELLGHSSSRTTEIYTHVSRKNIQKIISPFDTL